MPRATRKPAKPPARPSPRLRELCSDDFFRQTLDHLRTVCPVPRGCVVHCSRVPAVPGEHGRCDKLARTFTIELSRELTEYELVHVLLHEWAHMIGWRPNHPLSGDHGPDWGVWYSVVWRAYHGIT